MAQSLASLHVHVIFSTKNREALLLENIRSDLHAYMATVLKNVGCATLLINSREEHVHLLFDLGRTVSISTAVEEVKKSSSKWIKPKGASFSKFAWQAGYGAFAVSESNVAEVRAYIANQAEHHRERSFQEEYRSFLDRHGIDYDERYVWD